MSSERWKTLERETAKALGGRRVVQRWDLFQRRPDVIIEANGLGRLVADCKAWKRFTHHRLMEAIETKYCRHGETPLLVTKEPGQHGAYAVVPLEWLASLLNRVRDLERAS